MPFHFNFDQAVANLVNAFHPGDPVHPGDPIVPVIENEITGIVHTILFPGDPVHPGDPIIPLGTQVAHLVHDILHPGDPVEPPPVNDPHPTIVASDFLLT